jgi:aldehyde dehydrogenase (NAD+)
VPEITFAREGIASSSPITGEVITHVRITRPQEASAVIGQAAQAFTVWRKVPPPRRGEFVRILAEQLRASKDDLGRLVTLETGKIVSEGLGEVQEMIDILRLRRWVTAPALRPHHRDRAGRSPG